MKYLAVVFACLTAVIFGCCHEPYVVAKSASMTAYPAPVSGVVSVAKVTAEVCQQPLEVTSEFRADGTVEVCSYFCGAAVECSPICTVIDPSSIVK